MAAAVAPVAGVTEALLDLVAASFEHCDIGLVPQPGSEAMGTMAVTLALV